MPTPLCAACDDSGKALSCSVLKVLLPNARAVKKILIHALLLVMSIPSVLACDAQTTASSPGGTAGGKTIQITNPALTGARHLLYRLRKSDVIEIHFTFAPEYDQSLTIAPDGFITLKGAGDISAEGLTVPELTSAVSRAYSFMRDPEISVVLKDFERPFFLAGGQVGRPGKHELRSPTTVTEAIAIAGGLTEQSKHSQVVLFRKVRDGWVESYVLNVKAMLSSHKLVEDFELRTGDMIFVPQNRISKIKKFLPVASLSTFFTPAQF